ncbi:hypothetical protein ACVWZA_001865 [Sphingomonas sp. UYAg733]
MGGAQGCRSHPKADGPERRTFIERIVFEPIDPQANGRQLFYGLRYHIHITTEEEDITFHDQIGYWLWEPTTGLILQTVANPRGQVAIASGQASADADHLSPVAERGQTEYGICSTAFLEYAFRTDRYQIDVTFNPNGSWSYITGTMLTVHGRSEPFAHRDGNTLLRVERAKPNPWFQIVAAKRAGYANACGVTEIGWIAAALARKLEVMTKLHLAGSIALCTAAFATGIAVKSWWLDHRLRENPCSVRTWQPEIGYIDQSLDDRNCLPLGKPQKFRGEWNDFAMGGGFRADGDASNTIYDLSADGTTRARLQWLAGSRAAPEFFSGHRYRIEFIGRAGRRGNGLIDARPDVIVMDDIVSASMLRPTEKMNGR